MPTLDEVVRLCQQSPSMVINIELKMPAKEANVAQYRFDLAAKKVVDLVRQTQIGHRVMISSFDSRILDSVAAAFPPGSDRDFIIFSLRNRGAKPDPLDFAVNHDYMTGVVVLETYLRAKYVRKIHDQDRYIGVYKGRTEDFKLWEHVFSLEADFFYSDEPLLAMHTRDNL